MTTGILALAEGRKLPLTATLSRAHKINQRIGAKLNELRVAVQRLGQTTTVQAYTGPEQANRLRENADKALAQGLTYVRLVQAQEALRAAVGRMNASAGISDILAKVEANKRLITVCDTYLALEPNASTLSVADLEKSPVGHKLNDYGGVAVSGITPAALKPYAELRESLERENFALADQLADLNAGKVTFELHEELFELLSLKANGAKD